MGKIKVKVIEDVKLERFEEALAHILNQANELIEIKYANDSGRSAIVIYK